MVRRFALGAMFLAAPLFSQTAEALDPSVRNGTVQWVDLQETKDQIHRRAGAPAVMADFGAGYESWQFRIAGFDHHDYSHLLVFRRTNGKLLSITRVYEPERQVDEFFPPDGTRVFSTASNGVDFKVRVRLLPGGRFLLAPGTAKPGDPASQIVLLGRDALRNFYPWIDRQLSASVPAVAAGPDQPRK
ncbi:MAG: hypothetical protein R2729_29565 [Bryobacteraceae bacterium]